MACFAYVDLNPVRAGLTEAPEHFDYASIAERTHLLALDQDRSYDGETPHGLLPFIGCPRQDVPKGLPFRLNDYLELVDWTGRAMLENKCGYIPGDKPPMLERLQIEPKHWLCMTQYFESRFKGLVGTSYKLKSVCRKLDYQRTPNLGAVLQLLT